MMASRAIQVTAGRPDVGLPADLKHPTVALSGNYCCTTLAMLPLPF